MTRIIYLRDLFFNFLFGVVIIDCEIESTQWLGFIEDSRLSTIHTFYWFHSLRHFKFLKLIFGHRCESQRLFSSLSSYVKPNAISISPMLNVVSISYCLIRHCFNFTQMVVTFDTRVSASSLDLCLKNYYHSYAADVFSSVYGMAVKSCSESSRKIWNKNRKQNFTTQPIGRRY